MPLDDKFSEDNRNDFMLSSMNIITLRADAVTQINFNPDSPSPHSLTCNHTAAFSPFRPTRLYSFLLVTNRGPNEM